MHSNLYQLQIIIFYLCCRLLAIFGGFSFSSIFCDIILFYSCCYSKPSFNLFLFKINCPRLQFHYLFQSLCSNHFLIFPQDSQCYHFNFLHSLRLLFPFFNIKNVLLKFWHMFWRCFRQFIHLLNILCRTLDMNRLHL